MPINTNQHNGDLPILLNDQNEPTVPSGSIKLYAKTVAGRTEFFIKDSAATEIQITSNGVVNGGGGGGGIQTINGKSGTTVTLVTDDLSDATSVNKFVTQTEKNEIAAAYSHSTSPHAPANAEPNPTQVSSGEINAGTETAERSWSPADVKQAVLAHETGGGGSGLTQSTINVPAGASIAARASAATGVPSGWALYDGSNGSVTIPNLTADDLVIEHGLGYPMDLVALFDFFGIGLYQQIIYAAGDILHSSDLNQVALKAYGTLTQNQIGLLSFKY